MQLPETFWLCKQPHVGVDRQAAGVSWQRKDTLPELLLFVISQYWVYDQHSTPMPFLAHEKHGTGATSIACQTPFLHSVRLQN